MGAGKTYLGKKISEVRNIPFFDTDELIATKTGKEIVDLFRERGEGYFRSIESEILYSLPDNAIVATGGGIVEKEENRKLLNDLQNCLIWIDTPFAKCYERIKQGERPLAKLLSEEDLFAFWLKRNILYDDLAHINYPTENEKSIDDLLSLINSFFDDVIS